MPRQEQVVSVFVASPADVADERDKLEELIYELNNAHGRERGIRLDLIRWKNHSYPGVGVDSQEVINSQLPDDIDVFIGIMWCRYGTPTNRADSGTVEEFERAKARYDSDNDSVKIMFYFKDDPVPPSQLDTEQMTRVNDFRNHLGSEGALYWNFVGIQEFEKLVRLHLTRQIQTFTSIRTIEPSPQIENSDPSIQREVYEDVADDVGMFDLEDIIEDRFTELTDIANRISLATEELGNKIRSQTSKIEALPKDEKGNVDRKSVKQNLSRTASEMDIFTSRVSAEMPLFNAAMDSGMNAFIQTIQLLSDFTIDENAIKEAKSSILAMSSLRSELTTAQHAQIEFRDSIVGVPRMTSTFNKSKRLAVAALERFIDELERGKRLLLEAEKNLNEFIGHNKSVSE